MSKACNICNRPIVLTPSAKKRARKFGGKPSDYTAMFDSHADCLIKKRNKETSELIQRHR